LKPVGARNFSAYYRVLGPTQPPIQWIPRTLSLEVRRPGHEADHTPTSSAEVKECVELYLLSPNTPSWRGAHLKRSTGTTLPFIARLCVHRLQSHQIQMNVHEIFNQYPVVRLFLTLM